MKSTARLFGVGAAVLTLLAVGPEGVAAQYDAPPPPAAYALQNVTVVAADGTRTSGATLVVRDGVIEALAPGATVPADARVLEGDSLFVYPGLVDAQASSVDFEFPDPRDREDDEDVLAWDPPRSASGFMPHRRVAHHLTATGADVDGQREKGIVAGLVHPGDGMAPGQPAVLVFRADAEAPWELVMRESAGLSMSFDQASGVYPSQLFGVIAYLRQAFMDAERWAATRTAWDRDPSGMTAPSWDPDYEALRQAAAGQATVWFSADSDEDIRRVFDLADELGFRPAIVGGEEAWKLADEIARRNVPVLVSTDFPEPDEWDPEADTAGAAELEPDAAREKERIVNAWSNPGRLEAAGVRFALTTGGGSGELLEGARKAVEYGLSEAGALRAISATPAELLGVGALTRVATGSGATFIVTDGELLAEDVGVVYTFLEGHLEEGRALGGGGGGEPASDVSGEWEGSVGAQGMNIPFTMNLTMDPDGSLSGTMAVQGQGDADVSGSVSGRDVTITIEAPGLPDAITLKGTLSEDGTEVRGGGSTPMGEMDFRATKRPGGASAAGARAWSDFFFGGTTATTGSGGGR